MAESKPDYAALAQQAVDQGNVPTVPSTLYFTYTRPDGDTFVGPASHAENYLRQGFTITGEQTIENLVEWNEANAAKSTSTTSSTSSSASTTDASKTTAKAS